MIQEIIDEIKSAEAEADYLTSQALAEAGKLNLEADDQSVKIIEDARACVKSRRLVALELAKTQASILSDDLIKEGHQKALEISQSANIDLAATFIVEKFLNKYVSR
ncbi:MAG: hypothetical protein LBF68_00580 [Christensenellaceae bacterium]|jgi:vacuolar-type H+-ATPase subunit H|nr:hypothetical protein [Christensenellaceae bacterium]